MELTQRQSRKAAPLLLFCFLLPGWLATSVTAALPDASDSKAKVPFPSKLKSFAAEKDRYLKEVAKKAGAAVPAEVLGAFAAARRGDWNAALDAFGELQGRFETPGESEAEDVFQASLWGTTLEMRLALAEFQETEPKYALAFGEGIIRSIPPGSVYFGGTDAGRGLVTALSSSHSKGEPFFTLGQNHLMNERYLAYLRGMYGGKIYIPTAQDAHTALQQYLQDVRRREEHDRRFPNEPRQLRPGEGGATEDGAPVGNMLGLTAINSSLTKLIFDRNPNREFYLEENFPLDWMYPYLEPHGLILRVQRKATNSLSPTIVSADRKFWSRQQRDLIGDWLHPETSVQEICLFAEKIFARKDLSSFRGDPKFVKNEPACRMYSKLRSSIGGIYFWRMSSAAVAAEKERMQREADFAFRQAFAFCPSSVEVVFRYVSMLIGQKRPADALLVAQTAAKVDPTNPQLPSLIQQLQLLKERPHR
jgi:hypothetical protein